MACMTLEGSDGRKHLLVPLGCTSAALLASSFPSLLLP